MIKRIKTIVATALLTACVTLPLGTAFIAIADSNGGAVTTSTIQNSAPIRASLMRAAGEESITAVVKDEAKVAGKGWSTTKNAFKQGSTITADMLTVTKIATDGSTSTVDSSLVTIDGAIDTLGYSKIDVSSGLLTTSVYVPVYSEALDTLMEANGTATYEALATKYTTTVADNAKLTTENNSLKTSNSNLTNELNKLKDSDASLKQIASLTKDVVSLTNQLNTQKNEVASLTTTNKSLNSQIATLTSNNKVLTSEVGSLTKKNTELNTSNKSLQTSLNDANAQIQQLTANDDKSVLITDLQAQVKSLNSKISTYKTDTTKLNNTIDSLKTQVTTLEKQNKSYSSKNSSLEKDKSTLQKKVSSLNTSVSDKTKEINSLQSKVSNYKKQVEELELKLKASEELGQSVYQEPSDEVEQLFDTEQPIVSEEIQPDIHSAGSTVMITGTDGSEAEALVLGESDYGTLKKIGDTTVIEKSDSTLWLDTDNDGEPDQEAVLSNGKVITKAESYANQVQQVDDTPTPETPVAEQQNAAQSTAKRVNVKAVAAAAGVAAGVVGLVTSLIKGGASKGAKLQKTAKKDKASKVPKSTKIDKRNRQSSKRKRRETFEEEVFED